MNKPAISALIVNIQDDVTANPRKTWLDFPATIDEIDAAMKRIGFDGILEADYCFSKYKTSIIGLADLLPRHGHHAEINRLAKAINSMDRAALQKFTAFTYTEQAKESFQTILSYAESLTPGRNGHDQQNGRKKGKDHRDHGAR